MANAIPEKGPNALGKLKTLGPTEPWQVALLLPTRWDDLRHVTTDFTNLFPLEGEWFAVRGRLAGSPSVRFDGAPRMVGKITDGKNSIGFVAFGDTRALQKSMEQSREDLILFGIASYFNGGMWLRDVEIIQPNWVGKMRPCYPGKARVIGPQLVRHRVMTLLRDAIPRAAEFLRTELGMPDAEICRFAGVINWDLETVLRTAHLPQTLEEGEIAIKAMERIAALGAARKSLRHKQVEAGSMAFRDWRALANRLPFGLTDEQKGAVRDLIAGFSTGENVHALLSGDVGTGKTAVYGVVAASAVAAGHPVAVLMPNQQLAEQVHREILSWWPKIPCALVTEGSGDHDLPGTLMLVGTTALLFRDIGTRRLVIVDEQQKFSVQQREQMLSEGSRLLEVTATCIPRSQALIRYGVIRICRLTHCHVQKTIITKVWHGEDARDLFNGVKATVGQGGKVLVVYPKREHSGEKDTFAANATAESAFDMWNKIFPGRVRIAHGGHEDEINNSALDDMRNGCADLLVSTSLVEVGINIPNLRRVVVVHAERFGLSTLHQIRGRVARDGGEGYCDLYLPRKVRQDSMDRMSVMEKTNDGFEIAQHDMKLRGFGDLGAGSEKQTGADNSFLYGRQLRIDVMDSVLEELENADKNSKQVVCKRGLATGHDLDAYDGCLQEASGQEKNCAHLRALS